MSIVTEIVEMKLNGNINKQGFIQIVDGLETGFHTKQAGFIDTELLFNDKDDTWIMIQHWNSMEEMKAASSKMFKEIVTEPFRKAIDPHSITITVLPVLKKWELGD